MKLENVIYSGDNLIWLKKFPDKFIDLIYLDPPFNYKFPLRAQRRTGGYG